MIKTREQIDFDFNISYIEACLNSLMEIAIREQKNKDISSETIDDFVDLKDALIDDLNDLTKMMIAKRNKDGQNN